MITDITYVRILICCLYCCNVKFVFLATHASFLSFGVAGKGVVRCSFGCESDEHDDGRDGSRRWQVVFALIASFVFGH